MPTTDSCVTIIFELVVMKIIVSLAKQEHHKSFALVAKELILEILDRREDKELSALAESRDKKTVKRNLHADVWK